MNLFTFQNLQKQLDFIHEIDKLKYIQRKTRLFNSDRHENDAEHSWHLAMMAMVLAEHANGKIEVLKVIKMLLVHDLVEIDAGDVFFFDTNNNHDNRAEEQEAAKRIFGLLPEEQGAELIAIWEEFEENKTIESRFANAIDKLEPMMQNATNGGGTWKEFNVSRSTVIEKKEDMKNGSEHLWEHALKLLDECLENGDIKE
ncbi:MAG: putative hydrolase of HD superfamily [Cyclobacteriaceae bacterium]|jgi:putative hydrolase of HD superfamily